MKKNSSINKFRKIGLDVSKSVSEFLINIKSVDTDLFKSIIKQLGDCSRADFILLKPLPRFLTLHKRGDGDKRNSYHVINNTKKRQEQVLTSVFMRTLFRILKSSLSNLTKIEVKKKDSVNYDYHLALIENLYEQLFYFSSKATGPLRLVLENVNIEKLLTKIRDRIVELGIAKKNRIHLKITKDFPILTLDPEKIEDVLFTLICNAIRYSPVDKPIEVGTKCDDKSIEISVKDYGKGIDDDKMVKIFDKYYHIDRMINGNREADNFSIGLHHLEYIVESHGGKIQVQSEIDKGSIFSIIFKNKAFACNLFKIEYDSKKIKVTESDKKIDISFPSSIVYLNQISKITDSFMMKNNLLPEDLSSINLVLSESLANAIMHGSKNQNSKVRFIIIFSDSGVTLGIEDQGGKFFYPSFFEKFAKTRGLQAGGRGIFFLTHFMDEISYIINPDISTWLILYKSL